MLDTKYLDAMDWDQSTPDKVVKAALLRAHEIRQFEIDLYWKRANYFWLLQAAAFAAFGLVSAAEDKADQIPELLPLALSCLGFVSAYAGWLSAKGSKFWQKNWEKHIDCLEDAFEGRLHKTVWIGKRGIAHSVSRLNSDLIGCFSAFWALLSIWLVYDGDGLTAGTTIVGNYILDWPKIIALLIVVATIGVIWRLRSRWTGFEESPSPDEPTHGLYVLGRLLRLRPKSWKRRAWLQRREVTGESS